MRILLVVGARPNFMKAAPLLRELKSRDAQALLLHTGQHYDQYMSQVFFDELGLPPPDRCLGIGGSTQAEQTARIMVEFESVLPELDPGIVVVFGDVNSTLACSLVAAKAGVPVAHVEAGLRSFDRTMPEEINRIVTDALSSILYTPSRLAGENLEREGIPRDRIVFVGNVMIDTLLAYVEKARQSDILTSLHLTPRSFALLTLHRPSNVDHRESMEAFVDAIDELQRQLPVVFPVHPRADARLNEFGLIRILDAMPHLTRTPPLGYLHFIKLMSEARLVLTDSGGIQEETTVLGIPCLTVRENTERPETVCEGTNILVGTSPQRIMEAVSRVLSEETPPSRIPERWDGKAAARIADHLLSQCWLKNSQEESSCTG